MEMINNKQLSDFEIRELIKEKFHDQLYNNILSEEKKIDKDAFLQFLESDLIKESCFKCIKLAFAEQVSIRQVNMVANDVFPFAMLLYNEKYTNLMDDVWNVFRKWNEELAPQFSKNTKIRKAKILSDFAHFVSGQNNFYYINDDNKVCGGPQDLIIQRLLDEWADAGFPIEQQPEKQPKASSDELDSIVDSIDVKKNNGIRDKAIICLLAKTGISVSELCGLKVADVDFDNHKLLVNKGSDKKRTIVFDKTVKRALNNHLNVQRTKYPKQSDKPDCPLFISNKGLPISRITVFNLVKKYSRNAQIGKNVNPQKIRATVKRQLRAVKGDDKAKQVLGVKRFYKRDE